MGSERNIKEKSGSPPPSHPIPITIAIRSSTTTTTTSTTTTTTTTSAGTEIGGRRGMLGWVQRGIQRRRVGTPPLSQAHLLFTLLLLLAFLGITITNITTITTTTTTTTPTTTTRKMKLHHSIHACLQVTEILAISGIRKPWQIFWDYLQMQAEDSQSQELRRALPLGISIWPPCLS